MMSPTMPVRKVRMTSEFTIENQWMLSSVICRYTSHREAHLMSLCSHTTSYVKITSPPSAGSITCGRCFSKCPVGGCVHVDSFAYGTAVWFHLP
jgi:ferredoxin